MDASHHRDVSGGTHLVDATMFWSATSGGVRRYLEAKQAWLTRKVGWRHTIAAPTASGPGVASLPSVPLPASGGYRLPLRRGACRDALVGLQPDLIESGDPYRLAWASLDAADAMQVPAVAFCHSNLELLAATLVRGPLAGAAARAARRYAGRLYRRFDLVLAPSEVMRRHLLDWGVERVACQPLGVDAQLFHPARASAMWRNQLGLPAATRLLVYAGRFAPEKHLDVLSEAVQRLGPPYVLLALGAGPMPPRGDRVIVRPFVSDPMALARALASADIFVHAGDQETFGLSVLEAMACGTPVVARAAEGLAELVDDTVGAAVHDGRPDSFAQAIAALFRHDRTAASRRARERAESYDWNQVLPLLLMHYRQLLREGGRKHNGASSPPRRAERLPQ
ncbi:glycosyltransferase [Piscinibacter sp.]|uniref:glycosyltransferase n=1 Tax=Piscinibacter sp. TaxID=1903157 RepID=UPI002BB8FF5F|nr:glycosyltransferase [Albitalea sp.]HUG24758.1 glycosyltransferase [Albitalea sp.]